MDIGAVRADISLLKGRIGEGFVEAILRRAGYFVARVGRETQMPRLMKSGTDTYLPDRLAWRKENTGGRKATHHSTGSSPSKRNIAGTPMISCGARLLRSSLMPTSSRQPFALPR